MARSVGQAVDATPTVLAPRANPDLVGHEHAERELRRLLEGGRVPHAILLSGPRGIGKATLAFRFARFLLATRDHSTEMATERGLAVDPESGVFHRVAAGGTQRCGRDFGTELPAQRVPFLGEVERVQDVGVRGDDVHRVIDDERLSLVAAKHAGRKRPRDTQVLRVRRRDLREIAVPAVRVVSAGHQPLTVFVIRRSDRDRGARRAGGLGSR